jgi:hypothetical protein
MKPKGHAMKSSALSVLIVSSVPLCFLFAGCASSGQRGSLSEAIEKSNDDYKGDRRVADTRKDDDRHRRHHDRDDDDESSGGCLFGMLFSGEDDQEETPPATTYLRPAPPATAGDNFPFGIPGRNYFGCRVQTSNRISSNYTNSAGAAFLWINHYAVKKALELALQVEIITTDEKSRLFGSIDDIADIQLGFHGRRYSTPDFTFMGLYFKYGIDLNFLLWSYKNAVYSKVYNDFKEEIGIDTIRTDGVFGLSGDAGAGWSLLQTKHLKLSFEVLAGGTLFWFQTFQAFKNDMFLPDGYLKAGVELLLRSGKGD